MFGPDTTLGFTTSFLKSQLLTSIPYPDHDFTGQTIIVTGSNTGLGLEAARHILRLGASKLILAVRSISKGDAAAKDILESCAEDKPKVEVWQLDMSSRDSVKAFAERAKTLERLDAAVLNAGILTSKFVVQEGNETHLAVNVIGTMLLSFLLLPILQASASQTGRRGRLCIVGSDLMYLAAINELETEGKIIDKLNDPTQSNIGKRYGISKQLVYYGVQELARRNPLTSRSNVLITNITPGACKTDIFRDDAGVVSSVVMGIATSMIARTSEVGSRTLVHGISEVPEEAHGRFLMDCRVAPDGKNVASDQGKRLAAKWNQELFALLKE